MMRDMTTQYFLRTNICPLCKRSDETTIGIGAIGWRFLFYKDENHKTIDDWIKEFVEPNKIFDEYGNETSFESFINYIKSKRHLATLADKDPYVETDGEYDYEDLSKINQ